MHIFALTGVFLQICFSQIKFSKVLLTMPHLQHQGSVLCNAIALSEVDLETAAPDARKLVGTMILVDTEATLDITRCHFVPAGETLTIAPGTTFAVCEKLGDTPRGRKFVAVTSVVVNGPVAGLVCDDVDVQDATRDVVCPPGSSVKSVEEFALLTIVSLALALIIVVASAALIITLEAGFDNGGAAFFLAVVGILTVGTSLSIRAIESAHVKSTKRTLTTVILKDVTIATPKKLRKLAVSRKDDHLSDA